jgi:hypothetical protein
MQKQVSVIQSGTYTYDGTAQTITLAVDGRCGDDDIVATIAKITNAGTTTPEFIISGTAAGNYEITNADNKVEVTILPKELTIGITLSPEELTKVYGKKDPSFIATLDGKVPGDDITVLLARTPGEDVITGGGYAVRILYHDLKGNYVITNPNFEVLFTITPRQLEVTANNVSMNFNDPVEPPLTYVISGFMSDWGDELTGSLHRVIPEGADGSLPGTYTIDNSGPNPLRVADAYKHNYIENIIVNPGVFTIFAIDYNDIESVEDKTVEYTGVEEHYLSVPISDPAVTITYTYTDGITTRTAVYKYGEEENFLYFKDAGTYNIGIKIEKPGYIDKNFEVDLIITPKPTSVSQSGTYTYNGTAQTIALVVDGRCGDDDIVATIAKITNAGSYTPVFTITGADAGNYEITNVDNQVSVTINKAPLTVSQNMSSIPTYTGSTIKTYLTVVGFVNGETGAAYVETRNVPTAPLAVQTEGIELNNYSIASEIVFTMNKKQTSVSQSGTYTYNGTAQTFALLVISCPTNPTAVK